MINLVAFTIAAVVWIILWAIGAKAIDAALVAIMIIVGAAAAYTYIPLLKKTLNPDK
ncbi:MAG TPA: hypothetical protein VGO97_01235 [Solirubrobacterales bacterium]|jgi:hypothetical protein|nr:hypothetical protein [Solirubrobacterales bacterium]